MYNMERYCTRLRRLVQYLSILYITLYNNLLVCHMKLYFWISCYIYVKYCKLHVVFIYLLIPAASSSTHSTGAWFSFFNLLSASFRGSNSSRSNFSLMSSLNIWHCSFQLSSWKIGMICEIMASLTF